jgi:hypothetical protein
VLYKRFQFGLMLSVSLTLILSLSFSTKELAAETNGNKSSSVSTIEEELASDNSSPTAANISLPVGSDSSEANAGDTAIDAVSGGTVSLSGGTVAVSFDPHGLPESINVSVNRTAMISLPNNFALRGPVVTVQGQWLGSEERVIELDPQARTRALSDGPKPFPVESRYWATINFQVPADYLSDEGIAIARLDGASRKWEILPNSDRCRKRNGRSPNGSFGFLCSD